MYIFKPTTTGWPGNLDSWDNVVPVGKYAGML